jgi:NADH-quinone oxidoreductase subunit G
MLKVTINEKTFEVEPGTTVLQAAHRVGIEIPHFCYHPRLSIAGNCRLCLVELENLPKLQTACSTVCADGMVVRTDTERVKKAVTGVLEFLLINHPVDCPVCDQAGECGLQDYYMKFGLHGSRFTLDDKERKFKAKDIGGLIILDSERCVLCTRCMRFLREVVGTDELNIFHRGSHSSIDIYPGRPLKNRYTCNLAEVCPVGALTDRDFRFQCRVWFMGATRSICTGCATGCNLEVNYKNDRIYRLKASINDDVNGMWMCDIGRVTYKVVNESRILGPYRRSDGMETAGEWDALLYTGSMALSEIMKREGPSSVAVIASPGSSNEELYLTKKLALEVIGTPNLAFTSASAADPYHDDFLVREDKNPNTRGAKEIGIGPREGGLDFDGILKQAREGKLKGLVIVGSCLGDLGDVEVREVLGGADYVINIASNESAVSQNSSLVLASATFAEKGGTFTNYRGRVQRFHRAFPPRAGAKEDIWILTRLGRKLGATWDYRSVESVFDELALKERFFLGLNYGTIGALGIQVGEKV